MNVEATRNALVTRLASTNVVRILAQRAIHVPEMPNAACRITGRCATVPRDGEVIHKTNASDVSFNENNSVSFAYHCLFQQLSAKPTLIVPTTRPVTTKSVWILVTMDPCIAVRVRNVSHKITVPTVFASLAIRVIR